MITMRIYGVETCSCKALMRGRWTRDEPKAYVCQRCGKPVEGYELQWIQRKKELEKRQ